MGLGCPTRLEFLSILKLPDSTTVGFGVFSRSTWPKSRDGSMISRTSFLIVFVSSREGVSSRFKESERKLIERRWRCA